MERIQQRELRLLSTNSPDLLVRGLLHSTCCGILLIRWTAMSVSYSFVG